MCCQDARLQCFHGSCLRVFFVIEPQEVQRAMHQHMRPVGRDGFSLFRGLGTDDARADHNVAE